MKVSSDGEMTVTVSSCLKYVKATCLAEIY